MSNKIGFFFALSDFKPKILQAIVTMPRFQQCSFFEIGSFTVGYTFQKYAQEFYIDKKIFFEFIIFVIIIKKDLIHRNFRKITKID